MNSVCIMGNLTRDPEVRYTSNGDPITQFGLAYNAPKKGPDGAWTTEAHFFDVSAWGPRFEKLAEYLSKGAKVGVTGRLVQDRWKNDSGENRSKVKITATDITFAGTKADGEANADTEHDGDLPPDDADLKPGASKVNEDDIPF